MSISYRQVIYIERISLPSTQVIATAATYVAVTPEMLEQLDFSQGTLGQDLLAEHIGHLFDGDTLTGLGIRGGTRSENNRSSLATFNRVRGSLHLGHLYMRPSRGA